MKYPDFISNLSVVESCRIIENTNSNLKGGTKYGILKLSAYFVIMLASYTIFSGSTFAACTAVTIDYWYADWYADAWLTECNETSETTFYASYNHNTVNIVTGSRIRIGRTGTPASDDFIDTYPTGSTFNVLCSGRLDSGSVQYGPPHCDIQYGGAKKKLSKPATKKPTKPSTK